MMKALVVCNGSHLSWPLPGLLARAGFTVDVLSKTGLFAKSAFVNAAFTVLSRDSVAAHAIDLIHRRPDAYDWVVVTEDSLLADVLHADVPEAIKLKILPVMSAKDFSHLYSKIGLARVLAENGIAAPRFEVASTLTEALKAAEAIGFPLMLKVDSSHGGNGTHECRDADDIRKLNGLFNGQPLLLQKKIAGTLLDLSAVYFEGHLVHFSHGIMRICQKDFGPSVVRDYAPMAAAGRDIARELQKLGRALGAHGFGKRYYFEADMRPNIWVDCTTFFGDDPAPRIRDWFATKTALNPDAFGEGENRAAVFHVPCFLRLRNFELLTNRYNVWRYVPWQDRGLVLRLLTKKLFLHRLMQWGGRLPLQFQQRIKDRLARSGVF
jgi:hypothetical protein